MVYHRMSNIVPCTANWFSYKWSEVAQLCPTLWDPMDYSLSGFSIHGVFQARVLEWIAISFSRGSSRPRNQTWVSHIAGRFFTIGATREAPCLPWWRTTCLLDMGMPQSREGNFLEPRNQWLQPLLLSASILLWDHSRTTHLYSPFNEFQLLFLPALSF